MQDDRRILIRRAFLFGVPFLYLVLGLLHPMMDPVVGEEAARFVGLHLAQLFLIAGVAYMIWLLVDGVEGRAAAVARALIVPYAIAYTALDAIAGIGMGSLIRHANGLPAADRAFAARLVETLREPDVTGYAIYFAAGLLWLGAAVAVVVALRNLAPRPALVLMTLGAMVFAVAHPKPTGPIGMGLFLAGVAWLELRPREEGAAQAVSMQPT